MNRRALIFAAIPVLLSGCMVGPNFVPPGARVDAAWTERGNGSLGGSQSDLNLKWWRQFNDKELNKLVEKAYSQNLTLRTAALRILESRAALGIAEGGLFPQSQAASGELLRIGTGGSAPNVYFSNASVGFDAAWELDFWGKYRRSIEASDANLRADVADYDDILVSLTAEVASTYVNIRTFEERIRLARQNEDIQKGSLEIVRKQREAGTVTDLDVLQAEGLLSTTQAQIPNLQATLRQFHNALANLLGMTPGSARGMLDSGQGIPSVSREIGIGVPAELLRRRPDIRRAEMAAMAQSSRIGIAKADLYPSFTLVGALDFSSDDITPNDLDDIFDANSFGFTFGPTFRWNILNYGRIKNSVRVEDARFEQTITGYENTVLNAAREVEDAMTGFVYSQREAAFLRVGVTTAEKSSELSQLQYKEGLADYQRVLDSIRSLTQKQDQYAAIQGTIANQLISMYKALGGGWGEGNREETIPQDVKDKMRQRTNWGKMLDGPEPTSDGEQETKD